MSFILDALKKSESERQRQDAPGIANIPERGRQNTSSRWIWLIAGLLAINLTVVAGLMFRPDPEPAAIEAPVAIVEEEAAGASFSGIVSEAKRIQPAAAEPDPLPQQATTSPRPAIVSDKPTAGSVDEGLDSFNELRARGVLQLPDMHLDIHVYSSEPGDRFVFLNMSKYKENETLEEGPVIREITPDGVVLEFRSTTFLLPRE